MASFEDKELKEAEKVAKAEKSVDIFVYYFPEPIEWEGRTLDKLTFEFGSLTGYDFENIEDEMSAEGKVAISPEFSSAFLVKMAVRACKEGIDDNFIRHQNIGMYNQIRSRGRSFLLRSGQ